MKKPSTASASSSASSSSSSSTSTPSQAATPSSTIGNKTPPRPAHAMSQSLLDEIRNTRVGEEGKLARRKIRFCERSRRIRPGRSALRDLRDLRDLWDQRVLRALRILEREL